MEAGSVNRSTRTLAAMGAVFACIIFGFVNSLSSDGNCFTRPDMRAQLLARGMVFIMMNLCAHAGFWKAKRWGFYFYTLFWVLLTSVLGDTEDLGSRPDVYLQWFPVLFLIAVGFIFLPWHPAFRLKFFPDRPWPRFIVGYIIFFCYWVVALIGIVGLFMTGMLILYKILGVPVLFGQIFLVGGILGGFSVLFWLLARGLSRRKRWAYVIVILYFLGLLFSGYSQNLKYFSFATWQYYFPAMILMLLAGGFLGLFLSVPVRDFFFKRPQPDSPAAGTGPLPMEGIPGITPNIKRIFTAAGILFLAACVAITVILLWKKDEIAAFSQEVFPLWGLEQNFEKTGVPEFPRVLSVDKKKEAVKVSAGQDWGLKPGDVLKIYRGEEYKGEMTVSEVLPQGSWARPVPPLTVKGIRAKDEVVFDSPLFYYKRGDVYLALNQESAAREDYERVGHLDAQSPLRYLGLGKMAYAAQQYAQAISLLDQAIASDSGLAEAYYQRALVFYAMEDMAQPLADLSKAIELNPDFVEAYRLRLEINLKGSRFEECEADIQSLMGLNAALDPSLLKQLKMESGKMRVTQAPAAQESFKPRANNAKVQTAILPRGQVSSAEDPAGWRRVSFSEATTGQLVPINLEFIVPDGYVPASGDSWSLWGEPKDIKKVSKDMQDPISLFYADQPLFDFFYSMTVGYFADADKFNIEQNKENSKPSPGSKWQRTSIGGYPALISIDDYNGRILYSCHIATTMSTNVVTFTMVSGKSLSREDNESDWMTFLKGIRRPRFKAPPLEGEDATDTLREIKNALIPNGRKAKIRIALKIVAGPENAVERPTFEQDIVLAQGERGFERMDLQGRTSGTAIVTRDGSVSNIEAWEFPIPSIDEERMTREGDQIKVDVTQDGQTFSSEVPFQEFGKYSPAMALLGGQPFAVTQKDLLEDLLGIYDFKQTEAGGKIILRGVGNKDRLKSKMPEASFRNLPEFYHDVDLVEEALRNHGKATVTVNRATHEIEEFIVDGELRMQPVRTVIHFQNE
ncbi:MAG TPA: hypothetical protein PLB05_03705 [Candidatus Omnitrophota bacterium]|nr:hypothetical protein [Candidatus Omnitrophota bacterium]HPN55515.1 hypothetical protein [Candidatus Omnitrophota bacterium]